MADRPATIIQLTDAQQQQLLAEQGVVADSVRYDPAAKTFSLVNPRRVERCEADEAESPPVPHRAIGDELCADPTVDDDQHSLQVEAAQSDRIVPGIEPLSFTISLPKSRETKIALWGECGADY